MLNHHILFESEVLSISYNAEDEWLYMKWFGKTPEDKLKKGLENVLKFVKSHKCTKILTDHRQRTGIWADTSAWANTWMPRAEEAGVKKIAIVYSDEQFSRLSTDHSISLYKGPVSILAFHELEYAENWLRSE